MPDAIRRARRSVVASGFAVAAAVAGLPARAEPVRDEAAALELFNRGKELQAAGDWAGACAKFKASMDLNPATGTLIRLARCDAHEDKLARAWADYQAALVLNRALASQSEERREELRQLVEKELAALQPRVPRLRVIIRHRPPEVHLFRDGARLPEAALGEELPIDPGTVEITVEAPGYVAVRRLVVAVEGQVANVEIVLDPVPVATPGPTRPTTMGGRRIAALVVGSAGMVGLGVAIGFGVDTVNKASASSLYCTPSEMCEKSGITLLSEASRSQTAAFVSLGLGAALVATGAALWLTVPRRPAAPRPAVTLGPRGAALRVLW
jgi:hypothetical protein